MEALGAVKFSKQPCQELKAPGILAALPAPGSNRDPGPGTRPLLSAAPSSLAPAWDTNDPAKELPLPRRPPVPPAQNTPPCSS